ncbi:MAG: class I SAM-dependent methyltransferase [Alphaproteobacteria bacterium]|nr:class I SAM-dependent methyltransferase [Alphaproteobacteria bacterium]
MSDTVTQTMDQLYRYQRHLYDATRKYYLFGRDQLIEDVNPKLGETVCEVGCGTARNLIKLAQRYPEARVFGLDASNAMLETAGKSLARSGLSDRVTLVQGYAQSFTPANFGLEKPIDHIVFSYTLTIIPEPEAALDNALAQLRPGGTIRVVDFGDLSGLPVWFQRVQTWWLTQFHVAYRPEIPEWFQRRSKDGSGQVSTRSIGGRYTNFYTLIKA